MRAVEDRNSERKERTATVELKSNGKSRGGAPIPRYYLKSLLPTPPMFSSALLLAQHAQKRHTKVEGREGGVGLTNIICCFKQYNGLTIYSFFTDSYLLLASFSFGFLYILVQKLIFNFDP